MIALLRGTLLEKYPNSVIVETGGVGYEITIPISTFSALPHTGEAVVLRVHTHVREDALSLFGFASLDEKRLFEKLIQVSGIGPKLAITVLSGLAAADLVHAIRQGQVELLVRIPGVGKKTAERMVLELRDKLDMLGLDRTSNATAPASPLDPVEEDVLSALMNLGCNRAAAEVAVKKAKAAGAGAEFDSLFRRSMEFIR